MKRHAKASPAGSTQRQANRLGRIFRGAFVTRGPSGGIEGSGAPSHRGRAALALLLTALLALVAVPDAGAAVPAKGVTGFFGSAGVFAGQMDAHRGVAVNQSTGNVYIADGPESNVGRIDVFDSSGKFLRTWSRDVIAYGPGDNGEGFEICIPANGDVCKEATGDAITVGNAGSSFSPQGVAINQASGDVYVSEQNNLRIQQFDQNGNFIRAFGRGVVKSGPDNKAGGAEVQSVTVKGGSGSFRLTVTASFGGGEPATTAPIAFNASAASVEAVLNALPNIGPEGGSIAVSGGPGDATGSNPYVLTFGGSLSGENLPDIMLDSSGLGQPTGTLLTCSSATAATTTSFQWLRNGAPIGGATAATYATTAADEGKAIQCQVFKANSGANAGAAIQVSSPRILAAPVPATNPPSAPALIVQPKASAFLVVGSTPSELTLTCDPGIWSGEPTLAFQWYRNGVALAGNGANTATYTVQTADIATRAAFQCAVTGTNAGGSTVKFSTTKSTTPAPSPATPGGNNNASPEAQVSYPESSATTIADGSAVFEICNVTDVCHRGIPGSAGGEFAETFKGQLAVAPAGAPNAGDVLVADPGNRRVQEFAPNGEFIRAFGFDVDSGGGSGFEVCTVAASCQAGAAGNGVGQFAAATPTAVAEDAAGNIYTVEPEGNFRVQKFTLPANVPTPQGSFDAADLEGSGPESAPTNVAIDPASGNLLVAKGFAAGATPSCPITGTASAEESRVLEVSAAGSLEGTHGTCAGITPANGLAVRGSNGNLYLSSSFKDQRVYVLNTGQPVAPTASITNVSGIGAHKATIEGLINPGGPELPYGTPTTYKVEYKRSADASFSSFFGTEGSAGNGTTNKAITASLDGLDPSTSYEVRLTANKGLGSGSASQTTSFTTSASAPTVALPEFASLAGEEAELTGVVNPNGQASGYHFDYVDQAGFEANGFNGATQVPPSDANLGSGSGSIAVSQAISGLSAGATYHYRLLATNPSGPSEASGTFTVPDPASCPNASLRAGQTSSTLPQGSTYLPSCMALEVVSPKKYNQKVEQPNLSASGDQVAFRSLAALAETPKQGGLEDVYIAARGASGWVTHSAQSPAYITEGSDTTGLPCTYNSDLSRWTLWGSTKGQTRINITTAFQNGIDGSFTPLSPTLVSATFGNTFSVNNGACEGGSADASRIFFSISDTAYLPGDPPSPPGSDTGVQANVYEAYLDDGTPTAKLLTRDASGTVYGGSCGARIGWADSGDLRGSRGAISPDTSRIYFTTRPTQPENGRCAAGVNKDRVMERLQTPAGPQISELVTSECSRVSPPCSQNDGNDNFRGASQEGGKVFFTSSRQLTNSDLDTGTGCVRSVSNSAGCDLYLYDASLPAGARLTQASAGDSTDPTPGRGAEVLGLVDMAGDGSHAYFLATGVLTTVPNALGRSAEAGEPNLYLYERDSAHPAGRIAFIATVASASTGGSAVPVLGADHEDQSIGGDGHILAFTTTSSLTPDDTDGGSADIYRYDSDTGDLERISKAAPGGSDNGAFTVEGGGSGVAGGGPLPQSISFNRGVSEDGGTIVFRTAEALDPDDVDGRLTAYVWHDGTITQMPSDEGFPMVSMSGEEVAFVSTASLLAEDGDNARDVYVARTDGGYPPPVPPVPCGGEACQGAPSAPPTGQGAASDSFSGAGNVKPSGKKKKHHKKRKKHHKRHAKQGKAGREQGGQK